MWLNLGVWECSSVRMVVGNLTLSVESCKIEKLEVHGKLWQMGKKNSVECVRRLCGGVLVPAPIVWCETQVYIGQDR